MIIPTRERPESLKLALDSVALQTLRPDIVLIVAEPNDKTIKSVETICDHFSLNLNVVLVPNTRSSNLSGAINSGLAYLLAGGFNLVETYVAILDDDDKWDSEYLETCFVTATQDNCDWVYAGIVRHESLADSGTELSIPSEVSTGNFFIGNPHIQGSNLFVRFLSLLQAGCFDEALESTNDRDVCIRLLDLGNLRVHRIAKHLVHHFALPNTNRISEPGSERKKQGLLYFYLKYAPRMTEEQRAAFKERSLEIFKVDIDRQLLLKCNDEPIPQHPKKLKGHVRFIVGIIATRLESLSLLLDDLAELQGKEEFIARVVIVDSSDETSSLMEISSNTRYSMLEIIIHSRVEIDSVFRSNGFGDYLTSREFGDSIAGGRSVLHHYLFKESMKVPGSIVWVIDDDIRLSYLSKDRKKRKLLASQILDEAVRLKKMGVAIGALRITGDPPIPGISTLRTQLLDIYYNLSKSVSNLQSISHLADYSWSILSGYSEYFYDYSQSHYSHLEFPSWNNHHDTDSLLQIVQGKALTRPRFWPAELSDTLDFVPLGGSYLVLNPECLRDFPVISPNIDGINGRRGDTFWGILNRYIRGRAVVQCDIAVQQVRNFENSSALSLDLLFSDFIGSSFVRSISKYYYQQEKRMGTLPARVRLTIDEKSIDDIIRQFEVHLKERCIQYNLNAYRIQGILGALKQLRAFDQDLYQIRELVQHLGDLFSTSQIEQFSEKLGNVNRTALNDFLNSLKPNVKSYRQSFELADYDDDAFILYSRRMTSKLAPYRKLTYLGKGREGVVWTDGKYAYKHFKFGWSQFEQGHGNFLTEHILQQEVSDKLVKLKQIIEDDGELVFKVELYAGDAYKGGNLIDITRLLRDCKKNNIAISNFHPHNLIVGTDGLKFCDIGRSIVPLNDREFMQMAKRAFLTYRFHFREDLDEIMARALYDESIPELFGFDLFIRSLEWSTKTAVLDNCLIELVRLRKPSRLMDYGCGKGQISDELSRIGIDTVAYDIDDSIIQRNKQRGSSVKYINNEELPSILKADEKFDCVLCSLVLCTIEDDDEVKRVVSNIRRMTSINGCAIIAICNPFFTPVTESDLHCKVNPIDELKYSRKIVYKKHVRETKRTRVDVHRPYSWYERLFHQCGFSVTNHIETSNIDTQRLLPSSEFLVMELKPIPLPTQEKVSLIIKASPMEWRTIDFQIRHIVKQLEGPHAFHEKIVITDRHDGPFLRAYDKPDHERFNEVLDILLSEKVVDKVVYAPTDVETVCSTYLKWFAVESEDTHSKNGQHAYTILYGFGQCTGDYILQVDSDCIIYRSDRNHDYLGEMIEVLESKPNALTVSFNISHSMNKPYTSSSKTGKWRVEVRCCLLDREKLVHTLPLPNSLTPEGILVDAWHRSLDNLIESSGFESFRGGTIQTFYIHVPNDRKSNPTEWFNIIKAVERGSIPDIQRGHVNLKGTIADWIGARNEEIIFLVRGRNTPIPLLRRCIDSAKQQTDTCWGMIMIDACSQNGMDEYIESIMARELEDKLSILRNHTPLPAIQNISIATRAICNNQESVIVHLDADDALIGSNVLTVLRDAYASGADITVGSMLRLDKHREYPVNFIEPRTNRGGNVWQHLRSFKKYLFDSIREEDLKIDNNWVPIAEDWAFMLPIVEMATSPQHIKEMIYFYEPAEQKKDEVRSLREEIIGQIVRKTRYTPFDIIRS